MPRTHTDARALLRTVAVKAMADYGLEPHWSAAAGRAAEAARPSSTRELRDLRALPWSSIDNDDSRDLDQLEVCVEADGVTRLLIAVADVASVVAKGSPVDDHARANTTSVYTAGGIFSMLPEALSTDKTSLNPDTDRAAMVVDMTVDAVGVITSSDLYPAAVHNHAKLAYRAVSAWLEGQGPPPAALGLVAGLEAQIRLQDRLGALLRTKRQADGALEFDRGQVDLVVDDRGVRELKDDVPDRANRIIESFMIAANTAAATFLTAHGWASIRRIVREPKRWPRIVELAATYGATLPPDPDAGALERFLSARRAAAPEDFADLSLAVLKLLGRGEYVAFGPGGLEGGHFALALGSYTHSTAPNRRYPDLITQRLLKAAIGKDRAPYSIGDLTVLAEHCTVQEDAANKVERRVRKSAAALWMSDRIGQVFTGIVTGASSKGTWVRLDGSGVEGKVEQGWEGLDVGERVNVRLVHTDAERGFVDFAAAKR